MAALPLQIRQQIRDSFDAPNSNVQALRGLVATDVGLDVNVTVQWVPLWAEVESQFPDRATFVPGLSSAVQAWMEVLRKSLNDDQQLADDLLERLKITNKDTIDLEVQSGENPVIKSEWNTDRSIFILYVPRGNRLGSVPELEKNLHQDIQDLPKHLSGFEEPSMEEGVGSAESQPLSDPFPTVDRLPRPEILFKTETPYILTLSYFSNLIKISCSHEKSLLLIHDYFKKYVRLKSGDESKVWVRSF